MVSSVGNKVFMNHPNIRFRVMQKEDKLKAIDLESKVFKQVLLNKMCNLSVEGHFDLMKDDALKEDNHLLSALAENSRNNTIVAGCRLEPFTDAFDSELLRTPQKGEPLIVQVISNLDAYWNELLIAMGLQPNPAEFAYIKTGFTHTDYHGQGLFSALWQFNEENLKSKGYKYCFSILVSKPVQRLRIGKLGFKVLKTIPYAEIPVYGEYPFREVVARNPEFKDETVIFGFKELN
jgi:hypothetical protein